MAMSIFYHVNRGTGEMSFTGQPLTNGKDYAYINLTNLMVAQSLSRAWQDFRIGKTESWFK
jgi:hypothetical protein